MLHRDELWRRFGLHFEIVNREFVARRRQERGFGVNPWATHTRFVISHSLLHRPEYRDPLLYHLGERAPKSLLILDEAHVAAPAAANRYAVDSRITTVIRDVAPRFENRLFLSATPHNGHSNSFSALLERIDREIAPTLALRLVVAPHGESSGWITFRVADMATVGGRPILDALVMLLGRSSFFGRAPSARLPALLEESRKRQADVTEELAEQVFRALELLLAGFEAAAERDGTDALDIEQIGSVYEALMGYRVVKVISPALCLRANRFWLETSELLERKGSRRVSWLREEAGLSRAEAKKLAEAVAGAVEESALLEALEPFRDKRRERAVAGRLVLQPGAERRRTSSHYTPRSLSAPIVRRTLEPLLAAIGEEPSSERLLDLKICDPAMGSGAFLVEACRFLADQVVAAWTREGRLEVVASAHEDVVNHARRLVAQRCLYGVDKNRFAVDLAKLSLWLETLARDLPFTFLDHALRWGDSLVGLDFEQIRGFHWRPEAQQTLASAALEEALSEAIALRQQILDLAGEGESAQREKERLLRDADDALDHARLIGDLVVGAFFAHGKAKDRELELAERLTAVGAWLNAGGGAPPPELEQMRMEIRSRVPIFHWMLELPEVFYADRPDPLDGGRVNHAAYIDAFIGNPPFAGKNQIAESGGPHYLDWLKLIHEGAHGNADLSAHFFRRADRLLGEHGTVGLIATNTIAQGDTRASGLQALVGEGLEIYDATRSMPWPGAAAVTVSVVHLAKGRPARRVEERRLDGESAEAINSRLRPKPERPDPRKLVRNQDLSFVGSYVLGMGFTLTPEEREELIATDPQNTERIFPYLGGLEVNSSPTQSHDRYVISFGQMKLEEAEKWPDLIEIVREKVKPERDRSSHARAPWWLHERPRYELYQAIRSLDKCVVTGIISKHSIFSFQPIDRIFSHKLYVFPLETHTSFATLQSRIHGGWAWLLSSTLKSDLNYSASDCFETFPFPKPDPREEIPELEAIGEHLYEARARYLVDTDQGLTQCYNRLKDPHEEDPRILELRRLHEDLDRAVLKAYGWPEVEVPPYTTPETEDERRRLEAFEDDVIDRLFVLNAERAQEERRLAQAAAAQSKAEGKGKKKSPPQKRRAPRAERVVLARDARCHSSGGLTENSKIPCPGSQATTLRRCFPELLRNEISASGPNTVLTRRGCPGGLIRRVATSPRSSRPKVASKVTPDRPKRTGAPSSSIRLWLGNLAPGSAGRSSITSVLRSLSGQSRGKCSPANSKIVTKATRVPKRLAPRFRKRTPEEPSVF